MRLARLVRRGSVLALVASFAFGVLVQCSSDDEGTSSPEADAQADATVTPPADGSSQEDAIADAAFDAADGATFDVERLLAGTFSPLVSLSSGHIVYYDEMAKEIRALGDTPGATPQTILPVAARSDIVRARSGGWVVVFERKSGDGGANKFAAWSPQTGFVELPDVAAIDNTFLGVQTSGAANALVYGVREGDGGSVLRLHVRLAASFSTATPLGTLTFPFPAPSSCRTRVTRQGTYVLLYGCPVGDATTTWASYDGAQAYAEKILATGYSTSPFVISEVDSAFLGTGRVILRKDSSEVLIHPLDGGTPTVLADVSPVAMSRGGGTVLVLADGGLALVRDGGTTPVGPAIANVLAVSPSFKHAAIATQQQIVPGDGGDLTLYDLRLLDLDDGGVSDVLADASTSSAAFTRDSNAVFWDEGFDPDERQRAAFVRIRGVAGGPVSELGRFTSLGVFNLQSLSSGGLLVDDELPDGGFSAGGSVTADIRYSAAPHPSRSDRIATGTVGGKLSVDARNVVFFVKRAGNADDGIWIARLRR